MRRLALIGALVGAAGLFGGWMPRGAFSNYTITGIGLSSTTTTGAANTQVGCVSVTTSPANHPWTGPVTLSGANAGNYVLTNAGMNPTCLNVGPTTINGGNAETDSITLTVTQ